MASGRARPPPSFMLYARLDLSRKRLDFRLLDADGVTVAQRLEPLRELRRLPLTAAVVVQVE
jgi:hypothetical protein